MKEAKQDEQKFLNSRTFSNHSVLTLSLASTPKQSGHRQSSARTAVSRSATSEHFLGSLNFQILSSTTARRERIGIVLEDTGESRGVLEDQAMSADVIR